MSFQVVKEPDVPLTYLWMHYLQYTGNSSLRCCPENCVLSTCDFKELESCSTPLWISCWYLTKIQYCSCQHAENWIFHCTFLAYSRISVAYTRCMWHLWGKNVLQWVIPEKIHTSLTKDISSIQEGGKEKCLNMSKKRGDMPMQVCPRGYTL